MKNSRLETPKKMGITGAKDKKLKSTNPVHTPKSQKGMGDYYGTGILAKIGTQKMEDGVGFESLSKKQLKTPPKALA